MSTLMNGRSVFFAEPSLRRMGDVSPLISPSSDHQGIDIPRSPETRSQSQRRMQHRSPLSLFRKVVIVALAMAAQLLGPIQSLKADDKTKEIAKSLLRGLIESQLERQERESFVPGRPAPPVHVPIPQPQRATPEMLQLRQLLASISLESDTLLAQLTNDSRRSLEARSLQPSAIQFQAAVAAVQQKAQRENNHLGLQFSVQTLSQSWRSLAHDLREVRGISQPTRESADRLGKLEAQLCKVLGIGESYNTRELVRSADLLAADLKTLIDELAFVNIQGGLRNGLTNRLRRVHDQSTVFANLAASGANYQNVVIEYQTLFAAWNAIRPELDQFSIRSIVTPVTRIQQTHRSIHQLLRLEFGPDYAMVQRLATNLDAEISALFRAVTLEHIMSLPDSRSLQANADALSGTSQNLVDVITRRDSLQDIGEAWVYLDEQWNLFEFYLQPVAAPEVRRRVEGVSQSINAVKTAIGIQVSFDPMTIRQQTAELASLADHLNTTVRRWTARTGQQNVALTQKVAQLQIKCDELANLSTGRRTIGQIRDACDAVIVIWQDVRPILDSCQTSERDSIEQTIDQFIPALVKLRTMLEE